MFVVCPSPEWLKITELNYIEKVFKGLVHTHYKHIQSVPNTLLGKDILLRGFTHILQDNRERSKT